MSIETRHPLPARLHTLAAMAGLCLHPLDTALAAERAASSAIERARSPR